MTQKDNLRQTLILASASPRRQQLLRQLGLLFVVMPAELDEDAWLRPSDPATRRNGAEPRPREGAGPEELAMGLAALKAQTVSERLKRERPSYGSSLILAADTLVLSQGQILGKPGDGEEARKMLWRLSGRRHEVITGLCLLRAETGEREVGYENTRVFFRALRGEEIEAYVLSGEAMDKAGAYGIQGYGAVFVERIEGCYYNVVGLPLARLAGMLSRQGVELTPAAGA